MIMWFYTHTGLLPLDRGTLFSKGKGRSESGKEGKWGKETGRSGMRETAVDMYYVKKEKNVMKQKR